MQIEATTKRLYLAQLEALENPKPVLPSRDQGGDMSKGKTMFLGGLHKAGTGLILLWRHGWLDQQLSPNRVDRQCNEQANDLPLM